MKTRLALATRRRCSRSPRSPPGSLAPRPASRPPPLSRRPCTTARCASRASPGRRDGHRHRAALARAPAAARHEPAQLRGRLLLAELRRGRDALPGRGGQHGRAVRRPPLHRRPRGHRAPAAADRDRRRGRPDPAQPVHLPGHPPLGQRAHRRGPRLPAAPGTGHAFVNGTPERRDHFGRGVFPGGRAARQRGRRQRDPAVPGRRAARGAPCRRTACSTPARCRPARTGWRCAAPAGPARPRSPSAGRSTRPPRHCPVSPGARASAGPRRTWTAPGTR